MDDQQLKEYYRQLVAAYRSGRISRLEFEMRLDELKRARVRSTPTPDNSDRPSRSPFPHPGSRFNVQIPTPVERRPVGSSSSSFGMSSSILLMPSDLLNPLRRERLEPGDVMGEKYLLQRLLGLGQSGEAWLAREMRSEIYVVLKPLPLAIQDDENAWKEFRDALRRARSLDHPAVRPIYRLEQDKTFGYFLVAAFVDAFPLNAYYEHYCREAGEFPVPAVLRVLQPVAVALDYAHGKGVLHRSLTPKNILIGRSCGVMTTDFDVPGTIRRELRKQGIETGEADPGPWRSPETWLSGRSLPASDLFSLGAFAFRLLIGERPFTGDRPEDIRDAILYNEISMPEDMPAHVAAALRRALAKKPGDRFTSCREFLRALAGSGESGLKISVEWSMLKKQRPTGAEHSRPILKMLEKAPSFRWSRSPRPADAELWPFTDLQTALEPGEYDASKRFSYPYSRSLLRASPFHGPTWNASAVWLTGFLAALGVGAALFFSSDAARDRPPTEARSDETGQSSSGRRAHREPDATGDWGKDVVPLETDELAQWTRQADLGDVEAQRRVGETYYYGKTVGVPPNYKKAAYYFQLGAEQNDRLSLYHLGRCYELGLGVPRDRGKAIETYRKAARFGSDISEKKLRELEP